MKEDYMYVQILFYEINYKIPTTNINTSENIWKISQFVDTIFQAV